jgi:tetratricopeptide (TPR) repeat protein
VQLLLGDIACDRATGPRGWERPDLARKCGAAYGRAVKLAADSLAYYEALAGFLQMAPRGLGGSRDSALVVAAAVRGRDEGRGTFLAAGILLRGNPASRARADSLMDALAKAHPMDVASVFRVADYNELRRRPERVFAAFQVLVDSEPDNVIAQYFLGRQMVEMRRDPRGARAHLRLAAQDYTPPRMIAGRGFNKGAPWWRLGQTYVQLKMPDSARVYFEEALAINPDFTEAKLSLDSLNRRRR